MFQTVRRFLGLFQTRIITTSDLNSEILTEYIVKTHFSLADNGSIDLQIAE